MRALLTLSAFAFAISGSAALAYENYLPLGTGYSTEVDSLPQFDSEEGQIIQQTDVYETELYMKKRKLVEDESRMREFFSDAESTGVDSHIDY